MDNIQNNPNLASMYVQQHSAEAAEAQGMSGIGKVSSPVTKDQVQAAEQVKSSISASVSGSDRPVLLAPKGEVPALPETTGNAWLNSSNMVAFLDTMTKVLKEKLRDTALEGKISVATQEASIAVGFAKAQEMLSKGMAQAFQYAVSAAVNFGGAAATGVAAAKQAQNTNKKIEYENKVAADQTHGMTKDEKAAFTSNQTRLDDIEKQIGTPQDRAANNGIAGSQRDSTNTRNLTPEEKANLAKEQNDLTNKQSDLISNARQRNDKELNDKQAVLQSSVQMITETTRGVDALNQACMQLVVAIHEKEIAEMETEQGAMQRGAESSSKTHASLNDDISNIINSMQEMVRKTNEAFSFRAA
jgi:hypothetical protein